LIGLFGLAGLAGQLFLALEQLVELDLVEILELLAEAASVGHPQAYGIFEGAGDVEQDPPAIVSCGQVQGAVQLAFVATAGGLAAGAGALLQRAAQERLLADELGQFRACGALGRGAV
jgi:hypothetical protein